MADFGIPDKLGPDLDARAAEYAVLSDLAAAQRTVARGMGVDRSTWNHAQQTALWRLHQGEGRSDDVSVSPTYGYDGAYFVEANTGPGGPR